MKAIRYVLLLGLVASMLSACNPKLSPFTQQLYRENGWSQEELRRIQFYLSESVVLRRNIGSGRSEIVSGEIKVVDGRRVDEVVIPRGTPGVFLFSPKENRFAISFEDRGDDRYLMFGPNPNSGNRYKLLASDWNRNRGIVTYDGRRYQVSSNDAMAGLLVDLKKTRRVSVKSRTARGRKVD